MATTEKQIEANRRNAQKSTGPRTEDGKTKSRLNAFRHGLTGQLDIMTGEMREAHDSFIANIVLSLKPERTARHSGGALCALSNDALENQLAHSVAESYWRMNRIPVFEDALLAQGDYVQFAHNRDREYSDLDRALSAARAFIEDPARFNLLTVYEARLHRKAQAELKQLREIQAERRADEKEAVQSSPKAAAKPARPVDSEAPATESGFVFSAAESGAGSQPGLVPLPAAHALTAADTVDRTLASSA